MYTLQCYDGKKAISSVDISHECWNHVMFIYLSSVISYIYHIFIAKFTCICSACVAAVNYKSMLTKHFAGFFCHCV